MTTHKRQPREDAQRAGQRPLVLVVGPGRQSKGGIASVIETLEKSLLAEHFRLVRVETHRDGPAPAKAAQGALALGRIVGRLLTRRADLLHIHTASRWSFRRKAVISWLARLFRRPYVLHVHGARFHDYYNELAGRVERRAIRNVLERAAVVVALSPVWEQRLRQIVPSRTAVVPNPVDLPEARDRGPLDPATIVCIGRLGIRKGSVTLVRALPEIARNHPAVRLVLAGDGDREAVVGEARRLGLLDRVEMPGWVETEERHALLRRATVFALPSRDEGLPVALLEAMAFGLPAVVTAVGGIPDLVREGEHGLYVAPDDPSDLARAIVQLLDDPKAADRMGKAGRQEIASHYASDVVAASMAEVLFASLPDGRRRQCLLNP